MANITGENSMAGHMDWEGNDLPNKKEDSRIVQTYQALISGLGIDEAFVASLDNGNRDKQKKEKKKPKKEKT